MILSESGNFSSLMVFCSLKELKNSLKQGFYYKKAQTSIVKAWF